MYKLPIDMISASSMKTMATTHSHVIKGNDYVIFYVHAKSKHRSNDCMQQFSLEQLLWGVHGQVESGDVGCREVDIVCSWTVMLGCGW